MKDRTSEYYALVERIKKRNGSKLNTYEKRRVPSARSEFARMASQLGHQIASTSEKLEQLTYLAKSSNGLTSNPAEINTMTQSIRQDIQKLNQRLKILQSVKDGQRSSSKQATEHSNNVVMSLQTKLADTSLGLKDILEFEVETQHQQATAQSSSPQPRRRVNVTQYNRDTYVEDTPQSLGIPMISQQQQQLQFMEQNDKRIETRTTAMESIESTIAELGGIFQQLATMVAEQRETIQRIDQNTDDIEMNVLGAQSELLKYYKNISTNRGLIIKIFITIIVLFLFFTIVL